MIFLWVMAGLDFFGSVLLICGVIKVGAVTWQSHGHNTLCPVVVTVCWGSGLHLAARGLEVTQNLTRERKMGGQKTKEIISWLQQQWINNILKYNTFFNAIGKGVVGSEWVSAFLTHLLYSMLLSLSCSLQENANLMIPACIKLFMDLILLVVLVLWLCHLTNIYLPVSFVMTFSVMAFVNLFLTAYSLIVLVVFYSEVSWFDCGCLFCACLLLLTSCTIVALGSLSLPCCIPAQTLN